MRFLGKLWRGEYPLHITFWCVGLGGFFLTVIVIPILLRNISAEPSPLTFVTGAFFIYFWAIIWGVATWKSATKYTGSTFWKYCAKGTLLFFVLGFFVKLFSNI
ncbi:hypothetical protein [Halodesulfovibrio spirochaetisodalis]|uniref:Uncharacterized protein n=1 Tax=Halodesulfovibrio spirochaetisodalis TaxID=1560234 RepID=A0A1B7XA61_9BACT|nr:hypothetical protein [Halodesulfovibrio spirochaetisodalis]OBQ46238.1 hypothetical protein SP90_13660 [Halodesulfovibrio spirochaetisodalis]